METYLFVYVTIFLVALVQIPIGVDMLRFFFPHWRLARLASKATYAILFTVMGTIFCIGLGYHLFVFLPLLADGNPLHSVVGILHISFALWVWINIVGNYYFAVFLHPGRQESAAGHKAESNVSGQGAAVPQQGGAANVHPKQSATWMPEGSASLSDDGALRSRQSVGEEVVDPIELHHPQVQNGQTTQTVPSSFIIYPPSPKSGLDWQPKKSQYCKICQTAVPYLDHHCPFTGNCTGINNFSNFYIGLLYGVVGLAYASAITLPYFCECDLKGIFWFIGLISDRQRSQVCVELGAHTHIFLPVFAGFVISSNMLFLQTLFLLADVSTYNVLKNSNRFPMLRFIRDRIHGRKFRDPNSRLNVLVVNQRPSLLWYIVPTSKYFFR